MGALARFHGRCPLVEGRQEFSFNALQMFSEPLPVFIPALLGGYPLGVEDFLDPLLIFVGKTHLISLCLTGPGHTSQSLAASSSDFIGSRVGTNSCAK